MVGEGGFEDDLIRENASFPCKNIPFLPQKKRNLNIISTVFIELFLITGRDSGTTQSKKQIKITSRHTQFLPVHTSNLLFNSIPCAYQHTPI